MLLLFVFIAKLLVTTPLFKKQYPPLYDTHAKWVHALFEEHKNEHFVGDLAFTISKLVASKLQAYAKFPFQLILEESKK